MSDTQEGLMWDSLTPDERGVIVGKTVIPRNISGVDITQVDDFDAVISLFEQYGIPPSTIMIFKDYVLVYGGIMGGERVASVDGEDRILHLS